MEATTYHPQGVEPANYLNVEHGWRSWLLTTDHKRIAILYLLSAHSFSLSVVRLR